MGSIITFLLASIFFACNSISKNKTVEAELNKNEDVTSVIIPGRYYMTNHHGPLEYYLKENYFLKIRNHGIYGLESIHIGHYESKSDTIILHADFRGNPPPSKDDIPDYLFDLRISELPDSNLFIEKVKIEIQGSDTMLQIIDGNQTIWTLNKK